MESVRHLLLALFHNGIVYIKNIVVIVIHMLNKVLSLCLANEALLFEQNQCRLQAAKYLLVDILTTLKAR